MKKYLFLALLVSNYGISQVNSNGTTTANITGQNPFFDASTNFDNSIVPDSNGKGLVFPRTDLTTWQFNTELLDGITFPSAFDGMIVYNIGTGTTLAGQGQVVSVSPGFYYFSNPGASTDITAGTWVKIGGAGVSNTILYGNTAPQNDIGIAGDFYINTSTNTIYGPKSSSTWPVGTSIVGSQGATGPQGPQGETGATGPQGPQGVTGATGLQGAAGTNGINGATWTSGTGEPSNASGSNGDYYLNTTTSDVYLKASGAYSIVTNIKGPQGATGAAGTNGTNGTNSTITRTSTSSLAIGVGTKSFAYSTVWNLGWVVGSRLRASNSATNYMEGVVTAVSATSVTINVDNISGSGTYNSWSIGIAGDKGATGDQGPQGIQGATGATGPQGLQGATGATGLQGAAGTNGINGATWTSGAGEPSNASGSNGDYYLNTTTSDVYLKASGVYSIVTNIKGPQGATGATGLQGPTGTNGTNSTITRTSTSSLAIGVGTKSFAYSTVWNLGWVVGSRLRASNSATNYMEGVVTDVSSTSVTINVDNISGSGTYNSWSIGIAGDKGATGAQGPQGIQGATGATGATGPAGSNATVTGTAPISVLNGTISLDNSGITTDKIADGTIVNADISDTAAIALSKIENLAANSVIANNTSSAATPTAIGMTSAATADYVAIRDSNANLYANNFINSFFSRTTVSTPILFTGLSRQIQEFKGSVAQTITLPATSTLTTGHQFYIINNSSANITVNSSGNNLVVSIPAASRALLTCILASAVTTAASWSVDLSSSTGSPASFTGSLSGDVTGTQSATTVGKINGVSLAGLSTGLLKNNISGVPTIAVAGTDYLTPTGSAAELTNFPTLNQNTTGTASNVTGTVAIANGGTGATTQQAAINALSGAQSSGKYLRSDGTNTSLSSIAAADVPTLNQNTTGTASNVTGSVAIANGGTGATTQQAAINALAGSQSSGKYLRSDGTNTSLSTIAAADVPTLNQNTTGTASNVTGTVAIANGGTGATTQQAAINALSGAQSSGKYLRSNGTNTSLSSIAAADVPTLNQNTTGTASNVTGTVAIANGGTGATTASGALSNLGAQPAITLGTISATSNANGQTLVGNTLSLTPADATNGGVLTTTTQTIAGSKTFNSAPTFSSFTSGSIPYFGTSGLLSQNNSRLFWDTANLRLGVGTNTPNATVEISGAAINSAPTIGTTSTIDFGTNNLAATSVISGTFTLNNLKNGGAYTLILTGTTNTATATFTATGFNFKYMGTVPMINGKSHIYSFIVVGSNVYVTMGIEN